MPNSLNPQSSPRRPEHACTMLLQRQHTLCTPPAPMHRGSGSVGIITGMARAQGGEQGSCLGSSKVMVRMASRDRSLGLLGAPRR